jgi:hypothetical protein
MLGYLKSRTAVEQEVASDPRTGVIPLAPLEELKRRFKDGPLLIAQLFRINFRSMQPLFECLTFRGHGNASLAVAFRAAEV